MKATLAPTVDALSRAYGLISEAEGLPAAVIVVKRDAKAWGHFTPAQTWSDGETHAHEIMISGENLARGARAVLGTLLHEAAHAKNHADGVKGTDTNGRHNQTFKAQAEAFGLEITQQNKAHGYSHTEVPDECVTRWAEAFALIEDGIKFAAALTSEGKEKPKARNKNNIKATCKCGNIIRLSQKVLDTGVICAECEWNYQATN